MLSCEQTGRKEGTAEKQYGLIQLAWYIELKFRIVTTWDGETVKTVSDFILGAPKSLQMVIAAMKLKDVYSLEGKLWPT